MPTPHKPLSIIIPTRNRCESLRRTLDAMAVQSLHSLHYEIIVADNASTDETAAVVRAARERHPTRKIVHIRTEQPGLVFGRHAGAKAAQGRILTFVDDDVDVAPDYAQHILEAFTDPAVVLVGGPCQPEYGGPVPREFGRLVPDQEETGDYLCSDLSLIVSGTTPHDVDPTWVMGLNFSIRADVLRHVGGFHPDGVPASLLCFRGDGETAVSLAIAGEHAGKGWRARYVPGARVRHIIPPARLTENYFLERRFAQGVSDSYSAVRRAGGPAFEKMPLPAMPTAAATFEGRLQDAYFNGWYFHQSAVDACPELLAWVLLPDYWEASYPALPEAFSPCRDAARQLRENPASLLDTPKGLFTLLFGYMYQLRIKESWSLFARLRASGSGAGIDWLRLRDQLACIEEDIVAKLVDFVSEHCGQEAASFAKRCVGSLIERLSSGSALHDDNSVEWYAYAREEALANDVGQNRALGKKNPLTILTGSLDRLCQEVRFKYALHGMLADERSRLLLEVLALYGTVGRSFIRLPYWRAQTPALRQALLDAARSEDLGGMGAALQRICGESTGKYDFYDLRPLGLDLRLYSTDEELYKHFFAPNYAYVSDTCSIEVVPGDIVLDCGACLCDTALLFAVKCREQGQVVSLEPMPENLVLSRKNLSLNPSVASRVRLLETAAGAENGFLDFQEGGPASHIGQGVRLPVRRLDDVVRELGLPRVDFLKMDIEGTELAALHGAEELLRAYRPKLAICLYHCPEDFETIPRYLVSLGLGYKFYLDHHYINQFETVLYAKV